MHFLIRHGSYNCVFMNSVKTYIVQCSLYFYISYNYRQMDILGLVGLHEIG